MQKNGPAKIPKFTSFRPKPSPPQDTSRKGIQSQPSKGNSDQDGSRYGKRSDSIEDTEKERRAQYSTPKPALSSKGPDPSGYQDKVFVIDRRGDSDNVRYGSIHRYSIPRYSRAGHGSVVGLHPSIKIDRVNSTEKSLVLYYKFSPATRNKQIFAKIHSQEENYVRPDNDDLVEELEKNYILLDRRNRTSSGGNMEGLQATSDLPDSNGDENYPGSEVKARPSADSEKQASYSSESKATGDFPGNTYPSSALAATGSSLSRKVEQEPGNPQAWLALIQHQDVLQSHRKAGRRATSSERRSYADIKVSLYEKALKTVTDSSFIEILLEGLLNEARLIWDDNRLRKKWEDALLKCSRSRRLWVRYLNFLQTASNKFKFDDIKAAYVKCFQMLRQPESSDTRGTDAETDAYLLLRLTLFLRDAGFPEQAVAIWQATWEWNARRPRRNFENPVDAGSAEEAMKRSIEDFWDAEVPRIGEHNSLGWASYCSQQEDLPPSEAHYSGVVGNSVSVLEEWGTIEVREEEANSQPARTSDDTNEEDPFRVVLFSDIKDFLLSFSVSNSLHLVNSFLLFCQLPPLPTNTDVVSWWEDIFVRNRTIRKIQSTSDPSESLSPPCHTDKGNSQAAKQSPFELSVPNFCTCSDALYARSQAWFSAFRSLRTSGHELSPSADLEWVNGVLESLIDTPVAGDEFLEYYIAFELFYFPNRARKAVKSLIKKQQSNLKLYNAYALVEYRLDKPDKGQDALRKAIQMSSTANPDTTLLRRTLIWETLEAEGTEAALSQFLATSGVPQARQDPGSLDAPTILSIQKDLLSNRDLGISLKSSLQILSSIDLLILLSYLTNPQPLEAALAIFNTNIFLLSTSLPPTSTTHQLLHQSLARLLYHHATRAPSFQPSLLRATLAQTITLFPTNTIFLSLYAWNESRFRINDRVRTIVRDILDPPSQSNSTAASTSTAIPLRPQSQLIPHLFAISTELARHPTLGSNAHTIRSAFERALSPHSSSSSFFSASTSALAETTAHSPLLWSLYFSFEMQTGELKRAKDVFYRAIAACPWVKELYLLPWNYLKDIMGREELRGIYELVGERELRVRVAVEGD